MEKIIEILKVIFLAVIEGISEWLPISSTGHMLIVDEFLNFKASEAFKEMFFVVIQLGAILAVLVIFWKKLFPLKKNKENKIILDKDIMSIWFKVVVACIPGAIVTLLFDDYIEAHLHTPLVISLMLIFYGILFIVIETLNKNKKVKIDSMKELTYMSALYIGLFQVLAIIPGTSRSGATIIGALLIGVSRVIASEFTFYLAIPTMFGLSFLKLIKFGFNFQGNEIALLLIGCVVAFIVSMFVIKFLMNYIKKHDFKIFGIYRIILGIIVILTLCVF